MRMDQCLLLNNFFFEGIPYDFQFGLGLRLRLDNYIFCQAENLGLIDVTNKKHLIIVLCALYNDIYKIICSFFIGISNLV